MLRPVKFQRCDSCGQVITYWRNDPVERHANTIERLYGFTLKDLKSSRKTKYLVEARNHFWLLLCIEDEWSYPRAGHITGHQYTSVMHGLRAVSRDFFGTPKKASIYEIAKAYWLAVGLPEEEADAKAKKRANR